MTIGLITGIVVGPGVGVTIMGFLLSQSYSKGYEDGSQATKYYTKGLGN